MSQQIMHDTPKNKLNNLSTKVELRIRCVKFSVLGALKCDSAFGAVLLDKILLIEHCLSVFLFCNVIFPHVLQRVEKNTSNKFLEAVLLMFN